ncbi:MAG: carboxyl-terminal processing protease [Chloroflexota bacterium]|jgi:carboxyl-terminal processing protease|nr:carboxyl-terminal processing protease [Chloroflexota bacterium]
MLGGIALLLNGCMVTSDPALGSPDTEAPPRAAGDTGALSGTSDSTLSSADLLSIYQKIVIASVDQVDDTTLILAAIGGARTAAVDAGALPFETDILDQAALGLTGDPQGDWLGFASAYTTFLGKIQDVIDVSGVGQAAARGMISATKDPISRYLDRDAVAALQSSTSEGSIGVVLSPPAEPGPPMVRRLVTGGPAERAGVHVGDQLLAVGGQQTPGLDLSDVLQALNGASGSPVEVTVSTPGSAVPRSLTLQRLPARPPATTAEMRNGVAYVQVAALEQGATDAVRRALQDATSAGAQGWILDLRGNGDGSLQEAENLAALFVGSQTIGIVQSGPGQRSPIQSVGQPLANPLPLVVLVDGATAGPAELLAVAIQEYHAGRIVGTPTRGRLGNTSNVGLSDGSVAAITTTRILSATGATLLGTGVMPDESAAPQPEAAASGQDAPLERAVALLQQ